MVVDILGQNSALTSFEVVLITVVFSVTVTTLWLVIGWRAMRAHEKLADSISAFVKESAEEEEDGSST